MVELSIAWRHHGNQAFAPPLHPYVESFKGILWQGSPVKVSQIPFDGDVQDLVADCTVYNDAVNPLILCMARAGRCKHLHVRRQQQWREHAGWQLELFTHVAMPCDGVTLDRRGGRRRQRLTTQCSAIWWILPLQPKNTATRNAPANIVERHIVVV